MNSNHLKIIACISMAIDHIGVLLFPEVEVLRIIGRIAMPIFAFFIAEGCIYTHNRKRYLCEVLALAIVCQAFYVGELIIHDNFSELYLNILFTFSLSIIICSAILSKKISHIVLSIVFAFFLTNCLSRLIGFPIIFDYGIEGVLLPAFAALGRENKKSRMIYFIIGLFLFNIMYFDNMSLCWWSLLAVALIFFYNGERGDKRFKYGFYIFYPVHLAAIYALAELF